MTGLSEVSIRQKCAAEPWFMEFDGGLKLGKVPELFDKMAEAFEDVPEQAKSFRANAEFARAIYRQQIRDSLDPSKVGELCAAEPWTSSPSLEHIGDHRFGYVIEKFRRAKTLFEGHAEHKAYADAFEISRWLYLAQVENLSSSFATGKTQAEVYEMNALLWERAHKFEHDGTNRYGWLLTLCDLNGEYQRGESRKEPPEGQRFVIRDKQQTPRVEGPV